MAVAEPVAALVQAPVAVAESGGGAAGRARGGAGIGRRRRGRRDPPGPHQPRHQRPARGRLINHARAHRLPFAPAAVLRDAVRDEIARALPAYHGLPTSGALVALTGTGGSGKTRVAAALAAAYHAHSPLHARALVIGERPQLATLAELLAPHGIPVNQLIVQEPPEPRDGRLIVIDTPAISPADPTAISALHDTLHATPPTPSSSPSPPPPASAPPTSS